MERSVMNPKAVIIARCCYEQSDGSVVESEDTCGVAQAVTRSFALDFGGAANASEQPATRKQRTAS